jgi:hypothetical protein
MSRARTGNNTGTFKGRKEPNVRQTVQMNLWVNGLPDSPNLLHFIWKEQSEDDCEVLTGGAVGGAVPDRWIYGGTSAGLRPSAA